MKFLFVVLAIRQFFLLLHARAEAGKEKSLMQAPEKMLAALEK